MKVAVLCGGISSEHEISCLSAAGVISAIDRSKFETELIGITKSGKWVRLPENHVFEIRSGKLPTVPEDLDEIQIQEIDADVVFPVLHGPFGEDGTIQGLFEMFRIKYVGNGVLASALAMDKAVAKDVFKAHGLKTARSSIIRKGEPISNKGIAYPLFIKPARGGSSKGTHKVKKESELASAIEDAFNYDSKLLVEEAIVGREIECAIIEVNGEIKASLPGQVVIDPKFEFYDFEAKYLDNATTLDAPAKIKKIDELMEMAVIAFKALDCNGLARVDFLYTEDDQIIINELNTMPGFTQSSQYPRLWAATGLTYKEIVSILIENALKKSR